MNIFDTKKELSGLVLAGFILMGLLPLSNTIVPEDSIFHVAGYQLSLWGKYIAYAVLAMSLNLLWGYTGLLLSLIHI